MNEIVSKQIKNAQDLRDSYVKFFKVRGHKEIASASLFPENDSSVLFTTAGMHPLVPYLLGEKHPEGKRLVSCQKCIRTGDIDEVGDPNHLTYFEMLGNWSLGDYFKSDAISMSYEFLTKVLGIPVDKLAVTVFQGDESVARDEETYQIWRSLGLSEEQIYFYDREQNWWGPAGVTGPCGPDTEIFYDHGGAKCCESCGPACSCGKFVEIWNNVFMEYTKDESGNFERLEQKNVDTGMGLERVLPIVTGKKNAYETDVLEPLVKQLERITGRIMEGEMIHPFRVISDHMRAITFLLGDGKALVPSNTDQGYILRRLIRRTIRLFKKLGIKEENLYELADTVMVLNQMVYPELSEHRQFIMEKLRKEYHLFHKTLDSGMKLALQMLKKLPAGENLSGETAFMLYDTYGFPPEFTKEIAAEYGCSMDMEDFQLRFSEHQEKSRAGAEAKFKGGLADHSEQTIRLHTATHLLNGALRRVLGEGVYQRGSNINTDRLRFDFSFERKITPEELSEISKIVNEAIEKEINVTSDQMTVDEAKAQGAIGVFDKKYSEIVKVYTIDGYSKEICNGPHILNTRELGKFEILKEESSSAGVRRIKAILHEVTTK